MSAQFGALHAGSAVDDLRAGVIALDAASGRVHAEDVLPPGSWRIPDAQPRVVTLFERRARDLQALCQQLEIEHAFPGSEETFRRILRVFLSREPTKISAQATTKGDLLRLESGAFGQFLFFVGQFP